MSEPEIEFQFIPSEETSLRSYPLAYYSRSEGKITVILPDFEDSYLQQSLESQHKCMRGTSIPQKIALAIAHEFMHHLLHMEHGSIAGHSFDNIADKVGL